VDPCQTVHRKELGILSEFPQNRTLPILRILRVEIRPDFGPYFTPDSDASKEASGIWSIPLLSYALLSTGK